jgi:hypothetical protein
VSCINTVDATSSMRAGGGWRAVPRPHISAQVRVRHRGGRSRQRLTLSNGGTAIRGPLFLVLDGLPPRVRLRRPAGTTQAPVGDPFVKLDLSLDPGQSVSVVLNFSNPRQRHLRFDVRVLAGTGVP